MMHGMSEPDVLIIGAGPAGLAAGVAALERGRSVRVFERGAQAALRDRGDPSDLVSGVGGAGLYSDGKFSFAPAATALWTLEPSGALREAYEWTASLLREGGLEPPPFPSGDGTGAETTNGVKAYPSQYMSLGARARLIATLERRLGDGLTVGLDAQLRAEPGGVLTLWDSRPVRARAGVIASGRFGPLRYSGGLASTFRRVEVGMRVEQDASRFALDVGPAASLLDPKWVRRSLDDRLEWRTFCCCRRGEVIETRFDGLATVSGRADGPPTGRSNVGLDVRFRELDDATRALARVAAVASQPPMRLAAHELTADPSSSPVADRLGAMIARALAEGLEAFAEDLHADLSDAVLYLPALEGVGYYPPVDRTLNLAPRIWAAGDATGLFRGLVPALVSGRLAGTAAADSLLAP